MKTAVIILAVAIASIVSPAIGDDPPATRPRLAMSKPGAHTDRIIGSYLYEAYVMRRKERRAYALQQRRAMHSHRRPAVVRLSAPTWYARPPAYPIRSRYLSR